MRPPSKNYCGSHLLSHNHQVAVPSARMGLATGIGTVNRAFPHHYHHRKTNKPPPQKPHTESFSGGSGPRTAQRTRTPNNATCPPTKEWNNQIIKNLESKQNKLAHTNPKKWLMSDRCISTSQLHTLQCFHTRPINPIIYRTPHLTYVSWKSHLGAGFPLRCFQRLSIPNVANQPCSWRNNWHTRGSSVPVLSY